MNNFSYTQATTATEATGRLKDTPQAAHIAGGTTLLDLMKANLAEPPQLADVNLLPFKGIEQTKDGLRIGALERLNAVGEHPLVKEQFPAGSESLLLAASPQLRNMASIGGSSCNARAAATSATRPFRATSGCPARAARRWKATTITWPSWA